MTRSFPLAAGLLAATILGVVSRQPARAVDLLSENFDQLPLGQVQTFQSEVRHRAAWTTTPPSGAGVEGIWSIDNSAMPAQAMGDNLIGVAEFEGWSFVDRDWWITTAGGQGREEFLSASGVIAVADPDEWDDYGNPVLTTADTFDSTLRISSIPLQGIAPQSARLFFHSSWRQEVGNGGSQKATVTVKYNDPGATTLVLERWTSEESDPDFEPDATNKTYNIPVLNPAGATTATLEFRLFDAGNNWWWAIDNLSMFTGAAPAQDGALRLIINRDKQQVKIVNNTPGPVNLRGYSIESVFGTLNESAATYLGDANVNWQILDNPTSSELSEGYIPDQYVMPNLSANPALGEINLGPAWRKYHKDVDDITFRYLVVGRAEPVTGVIEFVGNGGQSFNPLDFNFDGLVNVLDYQTFLTNYTASLAGKNAVERYNLGDLNGDGSHSVRDFAQFRQQFDLANGPGALEAAIAAANGVPEPAGAMMAAVAVALMIPKRRRAWPAAAAALSVGLAAGNAPAAPLDETFNNVVLQASVEDNPTPGVWSDVGPTGWKVDRTGVPGYGTTSDGIKEWAGWNFANKDWWVATAGDQNRSQFTKGTGTVLVADPDEWDDAPHPDDGYYSTYITTPRLDVLPGVPAGQVRLSFDSSWRPEGFDDWILPGQTAPTNNQTGTVEVSVNGGPFQQVLKWDSQTGSPTFKADATNESIVDLSLNYNGAPNTSLQVRFGLTNAANDWWWALDNIRVSNVDVVLPIPPTLRINTATGIADIVGGGLIPEAITGFDISSANGNLAPQGNVGLSFTKPDTIDGPDPDAIAGSNIGESWQLAAATPNLFSEFFLEGSSTYMMARSDSLGRIFNPATPEAMRDVRFAYATVDGAILEGPVQYVASGGSSADFDTDGDVDGRDFLTWQRGLGTGTSLAQGNADGDGDVDGADLAIWKQQFGPAPAIAAAASVPEPGSLCLVVLAAIPAFVRRRPRRLVTASVALIPAMTACVAAQAQSIPAPFVDRDYRMGNNDPGAANGVTVSVTRDSAGQPMMNQLIDMTGQSRFGGLPTYVTISGRPDGGTGLGIRLNTNPTDRQYLRTGADEALNFPERSPSSTESTLGGPLQGTIDYTYITDRGFQLWVQPSAVNDAHIVMDSNNHGAIITPAGKFGMRYSGFDYPGLTSVVPGTWYHIMVVRAFGDLGSGSVLYVNGEAEAAAVGIYNGEDAPNDEQNPVNHDNSPLVIGSTTAESSFQVGTQKYFRGIVDDLEMFVMGLNNTADYGEFSFGRDNDWQAHFGPTTAGDLDNDHIITMSDVTTFAAHWRFEKRLMWTQGGTLRSLVVGDKTTRAIGDYNYDGRVNLADWGILNAANPAMGAAAMALIGGVPEPGSAALTGLAALPFVARLRRARRSQQSAPTRTQGVA